MEASATIATVSEAIFSPPIFVGCLILAYFLYEKHKDNDFFGQELETWLSVLAALILLTGLTTASDLDFADLLTLKTKPSRLVDTNITIGSNSYRVNPYRLDANLTLQVGINVIGPGGINTLMLNASEYEKFKTNRSSLNTLCFSNLANEGVRRANFSLTTPSNSTYYLILSTASLLSHQEQYDHPVSLHLRSYVTNVD